MGRIRVFAIFALTLSAFISQAADWRLVIASDDPDIRKAADVVIFEATGKLNPDDRITSITFSADADIEPNCVVSLDPTNGKAPLALGPDVEVYQGNVLIAGAKPTKKVIPAHIAIDTPATAGTKDGKLTNVMQPIINQVNNLPWVYIAVGVGIFLGIMALMNRRSQQFTTSMSKEAKNLYMETVGRITERLERIEVTQERLVKNPPVVRTFKSQIEDFEGRLGRIEKLAKEARDEAGRASAELSQGEKRHTDLVGKLDVNAVESTKIQGIVKQESDALRTELKLLLKGQDEVSLKLNTLDDIKVSDKHIEALLTNQEALIVTAQQEHTKLMQQMNAELATMRANQEALSAIPKELELVAASLASLPGQLDTIQSSMPRLDGLESRLDSVTDIGSKLDHISSFGQHLAPIADFDQKLSRLDEISDKLNALPDVQNALEALPKEFPSSEDELNRIHESLLLEIESLSDKVDESHEKLNNLISVHSIATKDVVETLAEQHELSESDFTEKTVAGDPSHDLQSDSTSVQEEEVVSEHAEDAVNIDETVDVAQVPETSTLVVEVSTEETQTQDLNESEVINDQEVQVDEHVEDLVLTSGENDDQPEVKSEIAEELWAEDHETPSLDFETAVDEELAAEEIKPEANIQEEIVAEILEEEAIESYQSNSEEESFDIPEQSDLPQVDQTSDAPKAKEMEYRYAEPEVALLPEFNFSNAVKKMVEEQVVPAIKDENVRAGQEAPITFKLDDLPTHLETFEDDGPDVVLQTFHLENSENQFEEDNGNEAAELILRNLGQEEPPSAITEDLDTETDEETESHVGVWGGNGGSGQRSWGSESSRPLHLVSFDGELKPLTPIETAPIGETIGAMVFGMGRVIYVSGKTVQGFWPGKDSRQVSFDQPIGNEDWRLAIKGQNLFVVEEKRVKIVSAQGWFVLEQFRGEYQDQLLMGNRWIGLRDDNGPLVDFRDMRGQMASEGIRLDMDRNTLQLAASDDKLFAASGDARFVEVTELGTEILGQGPTDSELLHLTAYGDEAVAVIKVEGKLECWKLGANVQSIRLDMDNLSAHPVLLGHRLYLANTERQALVAVNLKKMSSTEVSAFPGVSGLRKLIGVQHKNQHTLLAITTDSEKKGGRLLLVDAKTGHETTFGSVGQATANLIAADHHIVLSSSSQYQNVIRVLEPFAQRIAA